MGDRDNKILAERYIRDIYSHLGEFNLSKLRATLEYIAKNAVASCVTYYDEANPAVVEQKTRRKKLAAEAYKKLLPNILNAITYLYELEYKQSLIHKEYAQLAAGKFTEIEFCMRKISAYLRLFAISNVAIVHHLWADEEFDDKKPLLQQIISLEFPKYVHHLSKLNEDQMDKGSYFWNTDYEPIFQRMFSNDIAQQVAGLSLFFNVYHDDGRGLIVARGEMEARPGQLTHEEYPEFIIPLEMYEKASKINHRKVERELKQEIAGF